MKMSRVVRSRSRKNVSNTSVHSMVKQMLEARLEHKRITATGALADLSTSGVINTISMAVAQGDDISQRSGDLIRPRSLRIKYEFTAGASAGSSYMGRVIVFRDSMCAGSTPAVTDVLATAVPLAGYNSVNAQQNRFKILYDRNVAPIGVTNSQIITATVDIPLGGVIHYLGTTASAASQGKGSLFALFISSTASAGLFQYAWSYDLVFTDA